MTPNLDDKITAFVIGQTTEELEAMHKDFNQIQEAWNKAEPGAISDVDYELPDWLSYMQVEINFHLELRKEEEP